MELPRVNVKEMCKEMCKGGYYLDWLLSAIVIVITKVVIEDEVNFQKRYVPFLGEGEEDSTIAYPRTEKTVPAWVMYLVVVTVGPFLIFGLFQIRQRCLIDWHHACLSILEAFTVACLLKTTLNKVGRIRPHGLTGEDDDEDRSSYPSGYAAYSFSSMTVLSWYLIGKFKIFNKAVQGQFALFLACNIPIGVATYIAVTRIADYRNSFDDVNAGSFIGIVAGTVGYFLQYPWVFGEDSGQPKVRDECQEAEAATTSTPDAPDVAITVEASDKATGK